MDDKAMEAAARAAYIAHHENGPTEEAFGEPNMGRGGFKTEVTVWNAVAQAAISAYLAALEADGFVMVPVDPTEAMVKAMCAAIEDADMIFIPEDEGPPYRAAHWQNEAHDAYRAMIAARPQIVKE